MKIRESLSELLGCEQIKAQIRKQGASGIFRCTDMCTEEKICVCAQEYPILQFSPLLLSL